MAATEKALWRVVENLSNQSSCAFFSSFLRHELTTDNQYIHVLVPYKAGRHNTSRVFFHQISAPLIPGSLLELSPGILVSSPELLFVQMASLLNEGELIALGFELCGGYPSETNAKMTRSPLTSTRRLKTYLEKAGRLKGVRNARTALRHIQDKSASPRESELSALLCMPRKKGGYGLPKPLLNEPVELSKSAAKIARSPYLAVDAFWKEANIGIEYDGQAGHAEAHQRSRDSRRRDALAHDQIELITFTGPQLSSINETEALAHYIARKLQHEIKAPSIGLSEAHGRLRRELRSFHQKWL